MHWQILKREKLSEFLGNQFHGTSKTTMRSWLRHGLIRVNAQVVKVLDMELDVGNLVERLPPAPENIEGVTVVYQDEHLIVLDKPAGLLSVDTDARGKKNLFSMLKQHFVGGKVHVLHRLDQQTSGLIAFALNEAAFIELKKQLHDHLMQRRYMAIVPGTLPCEAGEWDYWMQEQKNLSVRVCYSTDEGAEQTLTFYRVLATKPNLEHGALSLVELELATGKKHQIRVSLAQIGHPIIGDDRYSGLKSKRLALHAYALSLFHPVTGQSMEWISSQNDRWETHWQQIQHQIIKMRPPRADSRNKSRAEGDPSASRRLLDDQYDDDDDDDDDYDDDDDNDYDDDDYDDDYDDEDDEIDEVDSDIEPEEMISRAFAPQSDKPRGAEPLTAKERYAKLRSSKSRANRPRIDKTADDEMDESQQEQPQQSEPQQSEPQQSESGGGSYYDKSAENKYDKPRSDKSKGDKPRRSRSSVTPRISTSRSGISRSERTRSDKPQGGKPQGGKPQGGKPQGGKPQGGKPKAASPKRNQRPK